MKKKAIRLFFCSLLALSMLLNVNHVLAATTIDAKVRLIAGTIGASYYYFKFDYDIENKGYDFSNENARFILTRSPYYEKKEGNGTRNVTSGYARLSYQLKDSSGKSIGSWVEVLDRGEINITRNIDIATAMLPEGGYTVSFSYNQNFDGETYITYKGDSWWGDSSGSFEQNDGWIRLGSYSFIVKRPVEATLTPEQAKQLKEASQNASLAKDYAWNSWQATLNLDRKIDTVENNLKNAFDSRLSTVENNLRNDISNLNSDLTNKLANINTSISNLQNFVTPTLTKVSGYNKATATKDSTFKVSLEYSAANEYRYNIDGSGWSTWTSLDSHDNNGYFTIGGISGNGVHTVVVEIRQATTSTDPQTKAPVTTYSPAAKGKYSFFKL
ncbi:hypothetical protein [Aneurinibacillus aneurinilyticus]|uniref:hypothetical protein n=2 Tax=Aneurinibacillus aneurinilyticus TaxID=1391 RepID=UPI003D1E79DB